MPAPVITIELWEDLTLAGLSAQMHETFGDSWDRVSGSVPLNRACLDDPDTFEREIAKRAKKYPISGSKVCIMLLCWRRAITAFN